MKIQESVSRCSASETHQEKKQKLKRIFFFKQIIIIYVVVVNRLRIFCQKGTHKLPLQWSWNQRWTTSSKVLVLSQIHIYQTRHLGVLGIGTALVWLHRGKKICKWNKPNGKSMPIYNLTFRKKKPWDRFWLQRPDHICKGSFVS